MKIKLLFLGLCFAVFSYAQMAQYGSWRVIAITDTAWYSVPLPADIMENASPTMADIRLFCIKGMGDTVEIPYLARIASPQVLTQEIPFKLINQSSKDGRYFYTFEMSESATINQLQLNFGLANFNWEIDLEGSQDQKEWFSVLQKRRVLAIKNEQTNFRFTTLTFSAANFNYYRINFSSTVAPNLLSASLRRDFKQEGDFEKHTILSSKIQQIKETKRTIIDLDLAGKREVSKLTFSVTTKPDYYRAMTISYAVDSYKIANSWQYKYIDLTSATLHSLAPKEFVFPSTVMSKIRITIDNKDNTPLQYDSFQVFGYKRSVVANFQEHGNYFLCYGNPTANSPNYDLVYFKDKIPTDLKTASLGETIEQPKAFIEIIKPLFENQRWLWVVMVFILILLGWFSMQMLKGK